MVLKRDRIVSFGMLEMGGVILGCHQNCAALQTFVGPDMLNVLKGLENTVLIVLS